MIVVVGYAMVINMMRAGYLMPFFYLGFVTAAFTDFNPLRWVSSVRLWLCCIFSSVRNTTNRKSLSLPAAKRPDNELD